jgi:transporter family-2 protein
MACGCFHALQTMSNGSVRSGVGAIWVGAMSATISALTLVLVAIAICRLPLPDTSLITVQGMKVVAGGMTGAFIVAGLAFVAPKLGPTETFIVYFLIIAVVSALIDRFGLLGRKQSNYRRDSLAAYCLPVSGWCSAAPEAVGRVRPSSPAQAPVDRIRRESIAALRDATSFTIRYLQTYVYYG